MDRYRAIDGRVRVTPNTLMPALVASRHATTLPNVLRAASLARMHVCVSAERVIATGLSEPGFTPVPVPAIRGAGFRSAKRDHALASNIRLAGTVWLNKVASKTTK
jgi:hypothetical protein